jgi:hypothetical protein
MSEKRHFFAHSCKLRNLASKDLCKIKKKKKKQKCIVGMYSLTIISEDMESNYLKSTTKKVNFHNQYAKNLYDGLLQIYQGDSKLWNITTDVASTSVGSRSPEMHVFSRSASYFCPAYFYGAAVFFVDGKERDKWSAHVCNVNESDRFWAVSTIYRKVGSKRGANEARSLADQ